ncbi:hypothetical protein PAHAL_3G097200 [Panicum hallii]|uniref:Uncharacterized protein n=1 Tax=Panicum hallii TaxID=206008 RepID=A0A2S3H7K1_9POAL|nr:hypothetical protein PAHAL_3G097200 [Panicum hallii]
MGTRNTSAARIPAALLLLLLLLPANPVSPASGASAPPAPATGGVELHEVSSVAGGVLVTSKVSSSDAPDAATSGGSRPLPPSSVMSRRALAAAKVIPPSGPSEGSNGYTLRPPAARQP